VLAAVKANSLVDLKLNVRSTRKEVTQLCVLLAENTYTSVEHADLFGFRLDDADAAHVATLCERSKALVSFISSARASRSTRRRA